MVKTCEELKTEIENGALLIDVRTPMEFNQVHLPGARLIPMDQIPHKLNDLDTETKLLLYCRTGARSGTVANYLTQLGYKAENVGGVMHYPGCVQH